MVLYWAQLILLAPGPNYLWVFLTKNELLCILEVIELLSYGRAYATPEANPQTQIWRDIRQMTPPQNCHPVQNAK
jgi:hypothetical protein